MERQDGQPQTINISRYEHGTIYDHSVTVVPGLGPAEAELFLNHIASGGDISWNPDPSDEQKSDCYAVRTADLPRLIQCLRKTLSQSSFELRGQGAWNPADGEEAMAQGWLISAYDGDPLQSQINKYDEDETERFKTDEAATLFVLGQAAKGNKLALRALQYLQLLCPAGWARLLTSYGYEVELEAPHVDVCHVVAVDAEAAAELALDRVGKEGDVLVETRPPDPGELPMAYRRLVVTKLDTGAEELRREL